MKTFAFFHSFLPVRVIINQTHTYRHMRIITASQSSANVSHFEVSSDFHPPGKPEKSDSVAHCHKDMTSRLPLGARFLQTVCNEDRPPAGLQTANYRCPSPILSRDRCVAARWNSCTRVDNSPRTTPSTPMRAPSPVGRSHVLGPRDNITVGLRLDSARDPSPQRRARSSSISYWDHLSGTGAHVDSFASTPRVRGKMAAPYYPSRDASPRPTGTRQVESRDSSPFMGVGILGPDPSEKKERPVPPPMVLKPFRRGVRYVPEPNSGYQKPRYSDEEPFRHSKRFVSPYTRDPTPTGVRTNLCDRSRALQLVNFVGSPFMPAKPEGSIAGQRAREKHSEFHGTSIRCVSPHTPMRRSFNIISNMDC